MPEPHNAWVVSIIVGVFLSSLVAVCLQVVRWVRGDGGVRYQLVEKVDLNWGWIVVFAGLYGWGFLRMGSLLPALSVLIPVTGLLMMGVEPVGYWGLMRERCVLCVFKKGLVWGFRLLAPLYLFAFVGFYLCGALGWHVEPQAAVRFFLNTHDWRIIVKFLVLAVVLAPIGEEVIFRGFFYPVLKDKLGWRGAMVVTSLIFGFVHLHAPTFLALSMFGVLLAAVYECTGNLLYPILLHAFFNGSSCALLLLMRVK